MKRLRGALIALKRQQQDARVEPLDEEEMLLERQLDALRPRNRADCVDAPRPCPFVSCRYHLYLEVTEAGSLRIPHDIELDELKETCALDVADAGGVTLDAVGELLAISRERVRQVEELALRRVKRGELEEG